ncbi:transcription regulator HTH, apses-type DNA-binding domain-containing protein [Gorgonomyces haynaldii]|nr:transcription regulator HTH, apses-type DNA-binding domain-containing protein [Gorgonomyces haynaldii]
MNSQKPKKIKVERVQPEDTVDSVEESVDQTEETPVAVETKRYASVNVFESLVNDIPVMKRQRDGYVNASNVLKAAKLPKKKRKKILDKLMTLKHEKVSVGFYLFQGIYVPLEDAKRLAKTWKLDKQLENLFNA